MMKPSSQILILAVAWGAALPQALASDGLITFTGQISTPSCTVSGSGGPNFTVTLPTVTRSTLSSADSSAGSTYFGITASGCDASIASIRTYFEATANVDPTTGLLNNTAPNGSNVKLRIRNADTGNAINLAASAGTQNVASITKAGSATQGFYAEYYAPVAATAGAFSSAISYTIVYN